MLEVRDIAVTFGALKAVDGVSLNFASTAITALIGPNGAGKTTLFNLLAGTLKPQAGEIRLAGERVDGLPAHAMFHRGLARTFQIPRPFGELSVLENLMVVPDERPGERFYDNWIVPGRVRRRELALRERARELLDFVTLGALADQPARILSGGQQKLLELARVLMGDPKMILLDEPAAGVNPALLQVIVERIQDIHRRGIGFVIIEHNIDLVTRICDPVVVMAQGRVLTTGDAATVRSDPRVIDAYLGDAP
ncbi:ABC transporter ATP-binding protein [Phreatobacter stygius]|uniref:ABC transporter ATP-binding protein n=1 Tax=Phreatobacter stygius TaxID=1940610 RepID=A0A4D7B0T5_9HYPH|nr:ABC transporter ATP-binding protein [Phreatobacter stygius]QCI63056.1 ABC transporter ATP-binding protein [Phreatobacter stygius]